LNRAAVQGLVTALNPKVSLATGQPPSGREAAEALGLARMFEDSIAYLRIVNVREDLAADLSSALRQFTATNQLKGLILDLRYARGTDYAAAVAVADLFVTKAHPLLDWGNGLVSSRDKTNALEIPAAVLVNRETAGAAEALAAMLRAAGSGLILGGTTAGQALVTKGFPLKSGGELRIATGPVKLGDGTALSTAGTRPDIEVAVNAEDEREYYADAYYARRQTNVLAGVSGSATNQAAARRTRFNEADLVREHREGLAPDAEPARPRPAEPEIPAVNDPTLARALDLLKGLAVVRQSRL
jgi:C-terminal processing protease CtpA/Prc